MRMLVELDGFTEWRVLFGRLKQGHLLIRPSVAFPNRFDDRARVDTLVNMKRDRRDFK